MRRDKHIDDLISAMEARVSNKRSLDEAQRNPGPWQRIHRPPRIPA
jgi:hypothetical protein